MFKKLNKLAYICGGAVRDFYIGQQPKDIDYVLTCTEEEFRKVFPCELSVPKVGNSFPVFLLNGNEIALSRKEENSGNSYQDFIVTGIGVDIETDLARRDFRCNALAIKYDTQELIDPFNGLADIHNKIISTHNYKCFEEDPLRILRAIRMSVRFGFEIEFNTFKMMKDNVHRLIYVSLERIELELRKTYEQSETPSRFFRLLHEINGLGIHFKELEEASLIPAGPEKYHPEGDTLSHLLIGFDIAKAKGYSYEVAIAALLHDLGKIRTPMNELPRHLFHECRIEVLEDFFARHRFSSEIMKLSKVSFRNHMRTHQLEKMKDIKKIRFIRNIPRYLRKEFLQVCDCDAELNQNQLDIFEKICHAVDTAKIDIPKEILGKGKDVIHNFVENCIMKRLKEI